MNFDIGAFAAGLRGENVGEYKAKQVSEERLKKEQERQDKQWEREDQMQAELDALDSKYKKPSAEEQRKKYDADQSAAKTAADVVSNPAANGIVPGVPQTEVKPVGFSSQVAANAAQNGIPMNADRSPVVNKAKPSIGDFTPKQPEFKPVENTFIDVLNHAADRMAIKAKYGKADETAQVQMMSAIKKFKDEGSDDAIAAWHRGDYAGGLKAFNDNGEYRGAQIVGTPEESTYEYAGQKIPTKIIQLQMPDGKIETINTAQYGAMRFKADQALKLMMEAGKNSADTKYKADTLQVTKDHYEREDRIRAAKQADVDSPAEAKLVNYYIEKHGMTPEEARKFVHSSKENTPEAHKARLITAIAGKDMIPEEKEAAIRDGFAQIDALFNVRKDVPAKQGVGQSDTVATPAKKNIDWSKY